MSDFADRMTRMAMAYGGAYGTWAERWVPGVCEHEAVRCIHGDEIIGRRWRRRACMICGRSLKGELPEFCWFTGRNHEQA